MPEDLAESFAAAIDATRRVLSQEAARGLDPAAEARLRPSMRIARLFSTRPTGVPAWLGLLALLEEYVLTWDAPETMRRGRWDAIHSRDGWRCACAGCTKRASLEAHHVQYRSRGGGDTPTNVISVCGVHHRLGEHGTFASCRGQAPLDIVWGLGDPALRRWYRNEQHIGRVVQSPA